jgi:hypothetical protein
VNGDDMPAYLAERGFSAELVAELGWRVEPLGDRCGRYGLPTSAYDAEVLVIPYRQGFDRIRLLEPDGWSGGKYRQPRGRALAPYDPWGVLKGAAQLAQALIIEGELNGAAVHEVMAGWSVIGLPGQGAFKASWAKPLGRCEEVVVWLDASDHGAERQLERIARELYRAGVYEVRQVADVPDAWDAADLLRIARHEGRLDDLRVYLDELVQGAVVVEPPVGKRPRYEPMTASSDDAEPTVWLWEHWLPLAAVALLIGEEGVGKGAWVAWLIARVTLGQLTGLLEGVPGRVLIVAGEDSWRRVWLPRLIAAGVQLELVDQLPPTAEGELLDVRADAREIRRLVAERGYVLVYFDQLLDNLPDDVPELRAKAVRRALVPLRSVVSELDFTVLATLHPNKSDSDARGRIYGTHAWRALARSVLWLVADHEDPDRRYVMVDKGNWVKAGARPARTFVLHSWQRHINAKPHDVPVVAQLRDSDMTMARWLADRPPDLATKVGQAEVVVRHLTRGGEWVPARPIIDLLAELGISGNTAAEAATKLGVERERRGMPGRMHWRVSVGVRQGDSDTGNRQNCLPVSQALEPQPEETG